jgi:uncharacterized protein
MQVETITTLDDLRRYREAILEIARRHRARTIRVFGSLVRGELSAESDIDFLVEFEPDYKLRDLIRLVQDLQNLLGRRVDVADANNLRDELRPYILKDVQAL